MKWLASLPTILAASLLCLSHLTCSSPSLQTDLPTERGWDLPRPKMILDAEKQSLYLITSQAVLADPQKRLFLITDWYCWVQDNHLDWGKNWSIHFYDEERFAGRPEDGPNHHLAFYEIKTSRWVTWPSLPERLKESVLHLKKSDCP